MLTHLSIRNIVLIDSCDIDFSSGLCVLTGETGAGKSILLDSLGLVLGARGDAALVRHGETSGSVTAEFDVQGNALVEAALTQLGIETDNTLIIRRTLNADGKSRALVNDCAVSVSALKTLGEALVEVHGQHDNRGLMDHSTHRDLLDEYGRHGALAAQLREQFRAWRDAGEAVKALEIAIAESKREEDYLRHMTRELAQLAPEIGEEERLGAQRAHMMQSEKMFATLSEALEELNGSSNVTLSLMTAQKLLARSPLNTENRFGPAIEALARAADETELAVQTLEALGHASEFDPATLERIEERLFALKAAARKYQLSADELASLCEEAKAKLSLLESRDTELAAVKKKESATREVYLKTAAAMTQKRLAAAKKLQKAVEAELEPLKMGSARIRIGVDPLPESQWSAGGVDAVNFEAATNVGKQKDVPYAPLAKIASGGELSRFMLAVKVALSDVRSTPSLVFDEIDTGTGGAVADAIGARLAVLGKTSQVLVVTHLPQVAARGSEHLMVAKREVKGRISTVVTRLAMKERQEELARMLAGSTITPEARKAAQKLLEDAV